MLGRKESNQTNQTLRLTRSTHVSLPPIQREDIRFVVLFALSSNQDLGETDSFAAASMKYWVKIVTQTKVQTFSPAGCLTYTE